MARRSLFNIIDQQTAWKADLVFLKETDFDIAQFERRRRMKALGQTVYIQSAEDSILSKLRWARKGESDRQLADARAVAQQQLAEGTLDIAYLRRWATETGLDALLAQVLAGDAER